MVVLLCVSGGLVVFICVPGGWGGFIVLPGNFRPVWGWYNISLWFSCGFWCLGLLCLVWGFLWVWDWIIVVCGLGWALIVDWV